MPEATSGGALVPPEPSQRFHGIDPRLGAPVADFIYRDSLGQAVMHVCTYMLKEDDPTAPTVDEAPVRFWVWDDASHEWRRLRAPPQHSPFYQLDRLLADPTLPVYVLDGEANAAALQSVFDLNVYPAIATTFPGGLSRPTLAEMVPLTGRPITLWVTYRSEKARQDAVKFASRLWGYGNHAIEFISPPTDKPTGWNISVAVEAGWTWDDLSGFLGDYRRAMQEATPPEIEIVERRETPIGGSLMDRWRIAGLSCASNGQPYPNIFNVTKIIEASKGGYCDVWLDEFRDTIMTRGSAEQDSREWLESDTLELTRFIQDPAGYGLSKISPGTVYEAVVLTGSKQRRNEVREWLQSLQWDGISRLNEVMKNGWGTDDNAYYSAVGRCFVMGAAARIVYPGCKVDTLPVFEGAQGIFKSTALLTIASERWYDEPSYDVGSLDFLQSLKGKWILEFAEMAVLSGRQGDKNNSVITRRTDTYRSSYGRKAQSFPRMCVFAATTNNTHWNDSEYGARRFWPVQCGKIDLRYIEEMREQLFAEAVSRIEDGELWYDVPKDLAVYEQEKRILPDEWESVIKEYLHLRQEVEMSDVLDKALVITDRSKWSPALMRRAARVLKSAGWIQIRTSSRRYWKNRSEQIRPEHLDGPPDGF